MKNWLLIDWLCAAACVLLAFLLIAYFLLVREERKQWETFREQHHCKVVSQVSGSAFNTIGSDLKGNVSIGVGSIAAKTGWLCDNGVTYFR